MGPMARVTTDADRVAMKCRSVWSVLICGMSCAGLAQRILAQTLPAVPGSLDFGSINQFSTPSATGNAAAAKGLQLFYGGDVGIGESDNVTLASTQQVSQTIATADVDFALQEQTRRLQAAARGDFSFYDYLQGAYGSQLLGRFDGQATFGIVPDRFNWVVREDFGQAGVDPYTPLTPNNIENVNYVSTGPDLDFRFGGLSFLDLSARYARSSYQTSPFSSNRLLGDAQLGLNLSAGSTVSLNGASERVLFDDTVDNIDFTRSSGFVDYEIQGARTHLTADLGATVISEKDNESQTGPLARFQLARVISATSKLTLTAGRELTDAASSFSVQSSGASGIVGFTPPPQTSLNYTSTYASLEWQYQRNRTLLAASARWERDDYRNDPTLNVSRPGAELRLVRRFTRVFTGQLIARAYKSDYSNAVVSGVNATSSYTQAVVGADVSWRAGHSLIVDFRYTHNAWIAAGPAAYNENRVFITVGYWPRLPAELEAVEENENAAESRESL